MCVCTLLTRHPSLGPHPSASPHVSSRRCRCTLPSTPADLQSAGLDLLCHAPSRDKATLDSDPWLWFNRFLIRLIYGSFFSSTITKKNTFPGRHHLAATPHSRWSPWNIWPILNLPVSCRPALVQVVGANVLGVMVCPCPTSLPRFSPATAHIFPATLLRPDLLASLFTHAQPSLPVLLPLGAGIPLKCFAQLEADYSQSYQAVFRLLAWGDILQSALPGSSEACSDFVFWGRHPCCR